MSARTVMLAAAVVTAVLAALAGAVDVARAAAPSELALARFVGTYRDVEADLGRVRTGPLELAVATRRNELRVHRNRLVLDPGEDGGRGDGTVAARLEVELEGWGDLVAVTDGGQRIDDRVTVPRQTLRLAGRLAVERVEGGFAFTYLGGAAPPPLAIESDLGEQILALCEGFAAVPLLGLDCRGLEGTFRAVALPLPEVGERFELGDEHLLPSEQALLAEHAATP